MTDGTFLSRAWPSIVALVGTVVVVLGLLFLFGDDDSGDDATTAGDDSVADESADDDAGTPAPDAEQTGDGTDSGDGDTSGESDGSADGDDGAEGEDSDGPPPTPVDAPPELRTPVGILNSTSIAGLAGSAQERFVGGGWEVPVITDYSGQVEGTIAYYPSDELQASAEALQAQFPEIRFVEPTPSGSNLARDRILVILAEDYAEAVGATEESG